MSESHVFSHVSSAGGLYHRSVCLDDDGALRIVGHDIGAGAIGGDEYEFERRVAPDDVRRFIAAIEVPGDARGVLEIVAAEFASSHELEQRLEAEGVTASFWSRVG